MNPTILAAIQSMQLPIVQVHVYYETEDEARRESYRTGQPFFVSVIGGTRLYSVRSAITNLK